MANLTRRGLFGWCGLAGGAAVLGETSPSASRPDRFDYHGFPIRWAGWRLMDNQDLRFGVWIASVPADESGRNMLAATTLGIVSRYREAEMLDLTRAPGWPWLTSASSERDADAVKARAVTALLERLNG